MDKDRTGKKEQTGTFLTLLIAYVGAFIFYAAGLAPARPARVFLGIDWSQVPVFLLLFTAVLLPALFGPGLDLFSYMSDRVYFLFLILTFFCCVLKYYSGAASRGEMALRLGLLLFIYLLLRIVYRRAFHYGCINKYALRVYILLLTGLSVPCLAAGFGDLGVWQIALILILFFCFFLPLTWAGRTERQETRPVRAVKRISLSLHKSPVPPAVFAFAPYLLADVFFR